MTEPAELSGIQCLELLERHGVGRVAFSTPMGPRIVPVRFALDGAEIVFWTAPYSEVGTYAPGEEVAFEVDDIDAAGHSGCSVVALGRAEVVEDVDVTRDTGSEGAAVEPPPGAEGQRSRCIRVRVHDFTGLRIDDPGTPLDLKPGAAGTCRR